MRPCCPSGVREALGELVGVAKEGLLALIVGEGLGVLAEMLEDEVYDVVGLSGKWDRNPRLSGIATMMVR